MEVVHTEAAAVVHMEEEAPTEEEVAEVMEMTHTIRMEAVAVAAATEEDAILMTETLLEILASTVAMSHHTMVCMSLETRKKLKTREKKKKEKEKVNYCSISNKFRLWNNYRGRRG